jgi:hypothetical protein
MDVESLAKELILKNMTPEQQMAVLDSVRQSVVQAKEVQKRKIGENVDLVVQALKKIESDIRSRYDDVGNAIEKRVASIQDGRDGADGKDGRDGKDGKNGRDGAKGDKGERGQDGRDGVDGDDGVSVTNARIDFDGSLIITLSTGVEINVGEVVAPDLAERIKVITNGGGTSQSVLDTLASLQTEIDNLIPSQTGNSGKFLTTNGTSVSWASVAGGLSYQGTWNASTNTPTLTSSVGVNGYYYIVSTAGSTNLDGITDWQIGDWLMFNGTVWQKIDQSNLVTSVAGRTGAITLANTDISGLGTMSTQNASSVAITGGTINGTTIGATTATTGAFTTLTVNDNATFGSSNTDTINFVGRINSDFDPATDNTYDLGRVGHEWRDLYIDGTANIDSLIADTADINAGTIDNTTIGATTPQNGSFVNLSVTGTTSFDGSQGTAGQVLTSAGTGATPTWTTPTTGTVTSVTGTSPVASSGGTTPAISLASGYGDTQNPYASKTANYVLAAPNGSDGVPTFRAVVAADIPTLNQNTTGSAATVTTTINSGVVATTQTAGDNSTKVATTAYVNAVTGTDGITGFKNRLINGNFSINQRAVSGTVTLSAGSYGHDRFKGGASGCTYTFATSANITTLTITAGSLIQVIEGTNLETATYTLSFSGTAQGKIGAGSFSSSGVTGSVTGGSNLNIEFNTGTLSLVQLEKGSTATSFDYRPYGTELALCQRYYEETNNNRSVEFQIQALTNGLMSTRFLVRKRASPTVTVFSSNTGVAGTVNNGNGNVQTGISGYAVYPDCFAVQMAGTTSQVYTYFFTASAEL